MVSSEALDKVWAIKPYSETLESMSLYAFGQTAAQLWESAHGKA